MFIIKYLKSLLYIFVSIFVFSALIGTLNYFNIIGNSATNIVELIAIIISMFIGGIYLGKNSQKKGYLEGLKIGLITIVILFLFSFLAYNQSISISTILFYIVILISSILGSVIGINKKSSRWTLNLIF